MRKYLYDLRKENNLTQARVAKKAGIAASYYNAIEKEERQADMTFSMIERLAVAFGVTAQEIFEKELEYISDKRIGA